MTKRTKKEVFEQDIKPHLGKVYDICEKNNMAWLSVVDVTEGEKEIAEIVTSLVLEVSCVPVVMKAIASIFLHDDGLMVASAVLYKLGFAQFANDMEKAEKKAAQEQFLAMVKGAM